jgi:hypothetical protein
MAAHRGTGSADLGQGLVERSRARPVAPRPSSPSAWLALPGGLLVALAIALPPAAGAASPTTPAPESGPAARLVSAQGVSSRARKKQAKARLRWSVRRSFGKTKLVLRGSRFPAKRKVVIRFGRLRVKGGRTDRKGKFSYRLDISSFAGRYRVTVRAGSTTRHFFFVVPGAGGEGDQPAEADALAGSPEGLPSETPPPPVTVDKKPPAVTLTTPPDGWSTNDTTPTFGGGAGALSGDLGTVRVRIYSGVFGNLVQTRTTTRSGGSWSVSASPPLSDGSYTVQAEQLDASGNVGLSAPRSFRVDTGAPAVSLAAPTDASSTNDPTPTFSGGAGAAAGDSSTVTVKLYSEASAAGTPVQTLSVTVAGGSWSVDAAAPLSEGTYTAQAEQLDSAGNRGLSATSTFKVDTTAPAVSLTDPAGGSLTNDTTPPFSGGAGASDGDSATVIIRIYSGTSASGTPVRTPTTTRTGGTWSLAPTSALADGTYTAQALQFDAAGNRGTSSASTFKIDTTAPGVSLNNPPNGSSTNDRTPVFSGAAGAASGDLSTITVRVYSGASASGTPVRTLTTARLGATWSVESSEPLAEGVYTARASQSDSAGNTGASADNTFTVEGPPPVTDTTPPAVGLTAPADASSTNDTTPTFSGGAGTAAGDSATVTVKVYSEPSASSTPVQTLTATAAGDSWSVDAAAPLSEGTYTAQAEQLDSAGNRGLSSTSTFKIDTTAPAVSLTDPASGSPTRDTTPTLSGAAGAADGDSATVTVKIYSGTSASGTPVRTLSVARSGGTWSVDASPALPEGAYTVQAEQIDSAGNRGLSATSSFKIDTTAPAVSLTDPANGSSTNDATPTLGGGAGTAPGDSSTVIVRVYSGPIVAGTPIQNLTTVRLGPVWSVASALPLAEGVYTARAVQFDSAGNRARSSPSTFTVDTTAPLVSLTEPASGSSSSDATPTFSGAAGTATGDASTVTVKLYSDTSTSGAPVQTLTATVAGGSWSVDASAPLSEGTYTAQAEQLDEAGNTGLSAANTFAVAAPPPSDPVIAAAGDISDNTLSGQDQTDELVVNQGLDAVLALGDIQYESGELANFNAYYDPTWGRVKSITFPSPGNHDPCPGSGYDEYFGSRAPGCWYSFDIGQWHFISLDSNRPADAAQLAFLTNDLATHANQCVLAYWHHARFSSGGVHGNDSSVAPFWNRLYAKGADVVLSGHDHIYERFAPQTPSAQSDDVYGIRQFVVGTGGKSLYGEGTIRANSEVRRTDTFGVLRLTLHPDSYEWRFVPVPGSSFSDSGSTSCHGDPPPAQPVGLSATSGGGKVDLTWTANTETDLDHYRLRRANSPTGPFTGVGGELRQESYSDTGLTDGTTYYYELDACDSAGGCGPDASAFATPRTVPAPQPSFPIRAAFYYAWFPEAWDQNGIKPFTKYEPSLAFYSSDTSTVRRSHLLSLEYARFDAGIYSWWGQGTKEDLRFPGMLSETNATGSSTKWALYHEREGNGPDPTVPEVGADLDYIKLHYASNPAYLKVGGKPVIFVNGDASDDCATADRWKQANTATRDFYVSLKVLAGYAACPSQPENWHQYAPASRTDHRPGHSFVISPEFDLTGPAPALLQRDLAAFEQAIRDMVASNEPWQLVTTFNEWGENSATESAREWASGSGHGQYLDALAGL